MILPVAIGRSKNYGLPFVKMGARDIRYRSVAFECSQQAVGLSPAAFIDPCLPTRVEKAPTAEN